MRLRTRLRPHEGQLRRVLKPQPLHPAPHPLYPVSMKVALLGFGTVGSSVARILCDLKPEGIELSLIFNRGIHRKMADWVPPSVIWTEDFEEVLKSSADVIVELVGGLEPAGYWVNSALEAGKSVVTGNKKLIAKHGVELDRLARSNGAQLLYGAAVAGGIPVIPGLQQGLAGDRITRIEGILNGTCNYILSRMETGDAFADVLKDSQRLGYAEANPSEDVDGYDARAKLVILSRIALRAALDVNRSPAARSPRRTPSTSSTPATCIARSARSQRPKYAGRVSATVGPMLLLLRSPFAWSRGTENMVLVSGQYGGDVVFSGHGAGGNPHGRLRSSPISFPSRTVRRHRRCRAAPPRSAGNSSCVTTFDSS